MSINCCFPFGTKEAVMAVFYIILSVYFVSVFIGGFKQGWRQEKILVSARSIFLNKLMAYGQTVRDRKPGFSPRRVHNLIERRDD